MNHYTRSLVWETEGERGAAERGWLGEAAFLKEMQRQCEEEWAYERERLEMERLENEETNSPSSAGGA